MPALQQSVMQKLYGHDIWEGYTPTSAADNVQGWNGDHTSLQHLAGAPGDKIVIDVGVWKGQSTITMARAIKDAGIDGCVIAIDTFLGSAEHWEGEAYERNFTRETGLPNLYRTFLSNVYHAGVQDYVVPMPQTSTTAALILQSRQITASVIHIDAAHEYLEVLRDAEEYWKILTPGGHLIGDDYDHSWPGVVRAAGEFSARVATSACYHSSKMDFEKILVATSYIT